MQTPIPGGFLIAIEGIDGAGKTTLAAGLAARLGHGGTRVQVTKEPTRGPWGMRLRESAATGRLTAQAEADYLILDRYYPSMVAYQGAAGLDVGDLMRANDFAPRPDILLLLDLPPAEGLARIRARGDTPNAFETRDTLEACRAIFLGMDVPNKHVLDATASADAVLQQALFIVMRAVAAKAQRSLPPVEAVGAIGALLPDLAAG